MIHCGDRGVLHSMMYGLHSPVRRRSVLHNPAIVAAGVPTVTERILSAETPEDATHLMTQIAANQDRDAFEALFRHYAPRVKAYMLKLGTDGALADEPADEQMDRVQRARLIRAAMQSLTEEQAEVIRLSFFEDKSHSVIAGELDLPLGTVKSRLRLAFGRIRKELGEDVL